MPADLLAYELHWRKDGEPAPPDADTILARCFEGIRDCALFAFLVTGGHGSGVEYRADPAFASYLELELFAAVAMRKPILILHLRGREPEPALRDCLALLSRSFADADYALGDEKELARYFEEAARLLASGLRRPVSEPAGVLPEWLSRRRSNGAAEHDLDDPGLFFLGGGFRGGASRADPDRAKFLLDRTQADKHGAALMRLWAAWRELGAPSDDPEIAALWDRLFGAWASTASWFGLHGHFLMSPLAALNSQVALRRMAGLGQEQGMREPHGARASALYSIAQRMRTRARKLYHYDQALEAATRAQAQDPDARSGVLSIRAHVQLRVAMLGRPWRLWAAEEDFAASLRLREASGAPLSSIGEAQVDLGFSRVLTGRPLGGFPLMREGIAHLRSDESANGKAFLARGLHKLERAAQLTLQRRLAARTRAERLVVAEDTEAFDQMRTD